MKNNRKKKEILALVLFFFACLLSLSIKGKAADLGIIYDSQLKKICSLDTTKTNGREIQSSYYKDGYVFGTLYDSTIKRFNVFYMNDSCSVVQQLADTVSKPGTGSDITYGKSSFMIASNDAPGKAINAVTFKNGKLNYYSTQYSGYYAYDGIAYDSANARYFLTYQDKLYTIKKISGAGQPTEIAELPKDETNGNSLKVFALDQSGSNIYVGMFDKADSLTYILVYNSNSNKYKYAVRIPSPSNSSTPAGMNYKDGSVYITYNDGKNIYFHSSEIAKHEQDFNARIANIELDAHEDVVVLEKNPFDFTNLYAVITYHSGGTERVKLDKSNTTVERFNNAIIGKQVVELKYKGYTFLCDVEVISNAVPLTSITLNKKELKLNINATAKLSVSYTPSDASNKRITWSTANPEIATVDQSGVVRAIATGETTVTATSMDGNKTATAKIIVLKELLNVELEVTEPIVITKYGEFDYTNLYIKSTYTDGEEIFTKLDEENCEIEGFNNEQEGQQTITVIYEEKRFETEITVSGLETRTVEPKKETPKVKEIAPTTTGIEASRDRGSRGIIIAILLISSLLIGIAVVLIIIGLRFKKNPPIQ
jgi:uncharacterized protein YjdB